MNTFTYNYPVKVYFGEKAASGNLAAELAKVGQNVLLAYGGGSIKKNGVYDELLDILKEAGKTVTEFTGIMSTRPTRRYRRALPLPGRRTLTSFWQWAAALSSTAARSSLPRRS